MGNSSSLSGSNKCRSEHQSCATICALTNSAPELGNSSITDALEAGNCIRTTCQDRNIICKANNAISAKGYISAGDGYSSQATSFNNGRPYRKQDNKVYVNHGSEIPYNGKLWNGRCYMVYKNGEVISWQDSNGNAFCREIIEYIMNECNLNGKNLSPEEINELVISDNDDLVILDDDDFIILSDDENIEKNNNSLVINE